MIYDDEPGPRRHLSLPPESLREMAARVTGRPKPAVVDAITKAAKGRAKGRDLSKVSLSRVKSDLGRSRVDVTVEQVAWVMVNVMRASAAHR